MERADGQNQPLNGVDIELFSFQRDVWLVSLDEQISAYGNLAVHTVTASLEIHEHTWKKVLEPKPLMRKTQDISIAPNQDAPLLPPEEMELLRRYGDAVEKITAIKIYSRQMMVVAASFLENILGDFIKCFFYRYPQRMHDYLESSENKKGQLELKDVLDAETREELVFSLAKRASDTVLRGNFKSVLKRIVKLTNGEFSSLYISKIVDIFDKRNKIVHELSEMFIDPNEVAGVFEFLKKIVGHLDEVSEKLGIPVDKRYSDET